MAGSSSSFIRPEEFWRSVGLRAGQQVVHLGCGAGFFLIPAAQFVGKSGRATGVDILPNLLAEVESRATRAGVADVVRTVRGDLEVAGGSTLPDDSADVVLVANILHQADPGKILTEAARIVRPTGKVIAVEWDVVATPLGPPPEQRVARGEVVTVAETVGLTQEKFFAPSPYHYGIIFTAVA